MERSYVKQISNVLFSVLSDRQTAINRRRFTHPRITYPVYLPKLIIQHRSVLISISSCCEEVHWSISNRVSDWFPSTSCVMFHDVCVGRRGIVIWKVGQRDEWRPPPWQDLSYREIDDHYSGVQLKTRSRPLIRPAPWDYTDIFRIDCFQVGLLLYTEWRVQGRIDGRVIPSTRGRITTSLRFGAIEGMID